MRIGPDIGDRIETFITLGAAMARNAFRFEMNLAALGRRFVDGKWIFRRPDTFGEIGLPFHHREIEVAALPVQWRAEPERRQQISRDRRFRVAVPMHPGPFIDVPDKTEFYRRIRLRSVQKTS